MNAPASLSIERNQFAHGACSVNVGQKQFVSTICLKLLIFYKLGLNSGGKAEEPPIPQISTDADHEWIDKGFEFTIIDLGVEVPPKPGYIKALRYRYHVWSKVIQSNDGGDGGCGGLGGIAGQLYAIGLEHRPNFSVSKQSGMISKFIQLTNVSGRTFILQFFKSYINYQL